MFGRRSTCVGPSMPRYAHHSRALRSLSAYLLVSTKIASGYLTNFSIIKTRSSSCMSRIHASIKCSSAPFNDCNHLPSFTENLLHRKLLPGGASQSHNSLPPKESQILAYNLRVLSMYPQLPWDILLEHGVLHGYLIILQNPVFVGRDCFYSACTSLAAVIRRDVPSQQTQTAMFTSILGSLVAVLRSG